jgi:hypothetical protein
MTSHPANCSSWGTLVEKKWQFCKTDSELLLLMTSISSHIHSTAYGRSRLTFPRDFIKLETDLTIKTVSHLRHGNGRGGHLSRQIWIIVVHQNCPKKGKNETQLFLHKSLFHILVDMSPTLFIGSRGIDRLVSCLGHGRVICWNLSHYS